MTNSWDVRTGNRIYTITRDVKPLFQVLVTGTVLDGVSGLPLHSALEVQAGVDGIFVKVLESGMFCIAGVVHRLFPALSTTPYSLVLTITAAGYSSRSVTVAIPVGAIFPIPTGGPILLQPETVRLRGRVVDNVSGNPVAGALVEIIDPPAPASPTNRHLVLLRTPFDTRHTSGLVVTSPGGSPAQLSWQAEPGDGIVQIDTPGSTTSPVSPITVVDPGSGDETRELGVLTGASGDYEAIGVGRAGMIYLRASYGGSVSRPAAWVIRYRERINIVDFRL